MRLSSLLLAVFATVVSVAGCGDTGSKGPALVPVSGNLTVGGSPVADVSVQLVPIIPKAGALTASGITDAKGNFSMTASNGKLGAPKGKYTVMLSFTPEMTQEEQAKAAMSRKAPTPKQLPFPKEYAKADTSPKDFEVSDKTPPLDLKL